jgi:very-short-patch-repair endonuclease
VPLPSHPPRAALDQGGVFTASQALDAGYSRHRIRRLVSDGRWVVVTGDVLASVSTPLTPAALARAATLATRCAAVVSHTTAARLMRYAVPPDPEVHLIVPRNDRVRLIGVRTHRIELDERRITLVDGVLCTDRLRTVVDCLLWLPEEAGRALMVDALRRRMLTVEEVRRDLRMTGQRHGLSRAWSVMRDVASGAYSEGEVRLHRELRRAGLTGWSANVAVRDEDGLIGVVDVLFASARLVIELDGRAFHSDPEGFQHDRTRQNRLVRAGYTVLRFTWEDVTTRPADVVAQIAAHLAHSA